ncbi:hypothetical protein DFA_05362 [Cavenderia fasciculata]|uniref:Uncharacterized protein n=1 Tax=Cavenderia fasciculata TaxID=261658 RepID=F4PL08_CACFS|nr:uncharacterized protein DFA_05362 [Cavenderia fasciculata]EGG23230.1 hypothetical protein DFA_05362 [Cavenderia fasciculata]|eukprot:XP_004361081.1 hypothetical protein DFA_05362 [Cavenderia fasciculata]
MLKLMTNNKRGHDTMSMDTSPITPPCTPFDFSQQQLQQQQLEQQHQHQQQQYQQHQQEQFNRSMIFSSLNNQQQQQQNINSNNNDAHRIKRVRQQTQTFARKDYDYFNKAESPINSVVTNLLSKEMEKKEKKDSNDMFKFNGGQNDHLLKMDSSFVPQQQQQQQQKNNSFSLGGESSSSSSSSGGDKKIFSLEEVRVLIKKALEEHEAKLRQEYETILQDKMHEQFQCFTRYNEDYLSKQLRESDFSYMS